MFNTLDIFVLGFFYSLEETAGYAFATRICAGLVYPLNFLVAKFQPLIIAESYINHRSLWKNKILQQGGDYKLWANAPSDINLN